MLCYVMLYALKIKNKTKISDDKVQTTCISSDHEQNTRKVSKRPE